MIRVRFPNAETERRAIGCLAGRFPFKTHADGSTFVPEAALAHLAAEGIACSVEPSAGAELVAYWQREGLIGSRVDIADSQLHARDIRKRAEKRG